MHAAQAMLGAAALIVIPTCLRISGCSCLLLLGGTPALTCHALPCNAMLGIAAIYIPGMVSRIGVEASTTSGSTACCKHAFAMQLSEQSGLRAWRCTHALPAIKQEKYPGQHTFRHKYSRASSLVGLSMTYPHQTPTHPHQTPHSGSPCPPWRRTAIDSLLYLNT